MQHQAEVNNLIQDPDQATSLGRALDGPTDNTIVGNTPQDQAIVITEGDPVILRRPIAQSPPVMISNDVLLKGLHYLRKQDREHKALKEQVGQIESVLPRTHRSGKQPFEEANQSGRRDGRGHACNHSA